jgi:hypothetical protein
LALVAHMAGIYCEEAVVGLLAIGGGFAGSTSSLNAFPSASLFSRGAAGRRGGGAAGRRGGGAAW